ncbi:MAG: hypothetical protein ABUL62_08475 [Myxococcales bacterium]
MARKQVSTKLGRPIVEQFSGRARHSLLGGQVSEYRIYFFSDAALVGPRFQKVRYG